MYRITITAHDGTCVLDLSNPDEHGARLIFESAQTYPGDVITLTQNGVCLKRRCIPDPENVPVHRPELEPLTL